MAYIFSTILGAFVLFSVAAHIALPIITPKKIPKNIPRTMQTAIDKINKKTSSDLDFVKRSYELVNKRYTSEGRGVFKHPLRLFGRDLKKIWKTKGFQPCDAQNYILRVMLIKSKRFSEKEIKTRYSTYYLTWPHQYLKIKIKNRWYEVDLWGADHKIPFGKHLKLTG